MRRTWYRGAPDWVFTQVAQLGGLLCVALILVAPAVQDWSDDIEKNNSGHRNGNKSRHMVVEYNSKTRPGCTLREVSKTVLTCKNVRFVDGFGERPGE